MWRGRTGGAFVGRPRGVVAGGSRRGFAEWGRVRRAAGSTAEGAARIARQIVRTGPGGGWGGDVDQAGHALGWRRPPGADGPPLAADRRCSEEGSLGAGVVAGAMRTAVLGWRGDAAGPGRGSLGARRCGGPMHFAVGTGRGRPAGGSVHLAACGAGRGGEDTHRRGDRLALWVYGLRRGFCVGGLLRPGAGLPGWRGRQGYPAADERGQGFRSGWMLA